MKTKPVPYECPGRMYTLLAEETNLPTLDRLMFENNIVSKGGKGVGQLVKVLQEHKALTVKVMECIRERELVLEHVCRYSCLFNNGAPPVEVQTKLLRLLYLLQRKTLRVVESIVRWRKQLTRPFGFIYEGTNYLLRVAYDSKALDNSPIAAVLPLRMSLHPLCSNVPSLSLFKCNSGATAISVTRPATSLGITLPPNYLIRLKTAELVIEREFESQISLYKELIDACMKGRFVPLINTSLVPNCTQGMAINSNKWSAKQAAVLRRCFEDLSEPPVKAKTAAVNTLSRFTDTDLTNEEAAGVIESMWEDSDGE